MADSRVASSPKRLFLNWRLVDLNERECHYASRRWETEQLVEQAEQDGKPELAASLRRDAEKLERKRAAVGARFDALVWKLDTLDGLCPPGPDPAPPAPLMVRAAVWRGARARGAGRRAGRRCRNARGGSSDDDGPSDPGDDADSPGVGQARRPALTSGGAQ